MGLTEEFKEYLREQIMEKQSPLYYGDILEMVDNWKPSEGKEQHHADNGRFTIPCVSSWVAYAWENLESRPPKYGRYFVHRKDGKTHWEVWNGSGWAYNGNSITYWAEIKPP